MPSSTEHIGTYLEDFEPLGFLFGRVGLAVRLAKWEERIRTQQKVILMEKRGWCGKREDAAAMLSPVRFERI